MTVAGAPPVGTIAMLFTDIEGSTALAGRLGPSWRDVLAEHHELVGGAITRAGGWVDGTEGDAFFATFADPHAAAMAALAAQRALAAHDWSPEVGSLKVRMGLHVGFVERTETGYVGLEIHRAARIGSAAHGGQLLMTAAAREMLAGVVEVEFLGAHRLKDFPAPVQLYCAVIDGRGAAAFPPPRTRDARPTNLPAGLPALVGRDHDLEQVREALLDDGERLISLTGRGGSGKTSLALVAAASLLDEHPGGVWWVDLAPVTNAAAVLDAVSAEVGADRELRSSPADAIVGRLSGGGATLIVLDNVEHVTSAGSELEALLAALGDLRLLVTTQVPLRVPAERVLAVDALDDEAALELIGRVARRRGARLASGHRDREALLDLVRLLDGLPLALELAAARLAVLTPAQLRDRLSSSLDLLKDTGEARPQRQRSLEATVEWTLGLLDDPPRELFTRLGVFAGPVQLEEIELIAGGEDLDVLEALAVLLDVALVRRVESGDGRIRFGLPEALRQLAEQRLDSAADANRWRRAHAERQLALIDVGALLGTADEYEAAIAADPEAARAIGWSREHDPTLAASLAAQRGVLLGNRGRVRDAEAMIRPLIDSLPEDADARALALDAYALLLQVINEEDALPYSEEAVGLARAPETMWTALFGRALVYADRGRFEDSLRDYRRLIELTPAQAPAKLAGVLIMYVQALVSAGRLEEAAEQLAAVRAVGGPVDASALRYVDTQEGDLAMAAGRPQDALDPYARSLERAEARGDALQVLFDLRGMANALAAVDRAEAAVEVHAMAGAQALELGGDPEIMGLHTLGDEPLRAALERLGPEHSEPALRRGRAVASGLRVARACQLARAWVVSTSAAREEAT